MPGQSHQNDIRMKVKMFSVSDRRAWLTLTDGTEGRNSYRVKPVQRRFSVRGNLIEILPLLVAMKRADKQYLPTATRPVRSKERTSDVEVMSIRLSVSSYLRITAGCTS